ncbi:MAG TPA: FKBP-type peptidyl-prolyl cis-trans isomerase [Methanocorpusculum sp.]|nr:FKBP-type peptidyl-prolyl cis-trans isomerase [Methanocorpusculum sp.]
MNYVTNNSTLLLHFTSRRQNGEIFEKTLSNAPVQITLGKKQINPAFEEALLGKSEGERVIIALPPEKAYGKYNKKLVVTVKRKKLNFEHEPSPGELIRIEFLKKPCFATVVSTTKKSITIDTNHPLAGETITYEITIDKIILS